MSHYKLLVSELSLSNEFRCLVEQSANPLSNWNSDRYGYISKLLMESFSQAEDKFYFIKLALNLPSKAHRSASVAEKRLLTKPLLGANYKGACKATATLRAIISLIELHLSSKKMVRFIPTYQQNFKISDTGYEKSILFRILPSLHRCLLFAKTPSCVERNRGSSLFPTKWKQAYKEHIDSFGTYSTKCNAISAYRRIVFSLGISDFSELNDSAIHEFRSIDMSGAVRSYGRAVPFFRQLGATGLTAEGVAASSPNPNRFMAISSSFGSNDKHNRLVDSRYYVYKDSEQKRCSGITDVVITVKRTLSNNKISFGDYEFNDKWSSYSLENLKGVESPWIKSQQEFIKTFPEASTRKNVVSALQKLNAYIFHYLKYFFSSNDVPYQFPEKISDFKNAIYIAPSDIVTEHLYKSTGIQFPLSLIDWIKNIHEETSDAVTKAVAKTIASYFDFVSLKYRGIDGYEINENPMSNMDLKRIRGYGYKRSNKKLMQLEYWKLFSEFLFALSERVISDIENGVSVPYTGRFSISVNKNIDFGESKIHIGVIEDISLKRCKIAKKCHVQPQILLAFLIMAKSGIRMANVMNLDLQTYDQNVDNLVPLDDADFIELHVNTDKAKNHAYTSLLSVPVFKLLKRFEAIRDQIKGVPITPIDYGGSEQSKWGDFIPLLATTEKNYWDATLLSELLQVFEKHAKNSKVDLGSELFFKPTFISPKAFSDLRATKQRTPIDRYCVHYTNGDASYFTPIDLATLITPHSLRKTLDTYYSILIGDKATGQFFTGQTEATVGYYREATPEVVDQVAAHIKNISIPSVVPVKKISRDDDEIRRQIARDGLSGIKGFTFSAIESDIDVQFSATNPSEIAINQTHICIYGNNCPPDILNSLHGKKNCAVCPVAIGTPYDGVAVVAQIKYHVDNIADINQQLLDKDHSSAELNSLKIARADELNFACSWFVRHKFIVAEAEKHGNFHVLDDGGERVKTKLKYMLSSSESEEIYSRLMETKASPNMQSNKLKQLASRLSRKLVKVIERGDIELPDVKPVEMALQLIGKVADAHGIPHNKLDELMKESGSVQKLSIDDLLQISGPDER